MQVYREAQQFLEPGKGTLQKRVFETARTKKLSTNPKHLYALVSSTLKYKPFLDYIIKKTHLMVDAKKAKLPQDIAMMLIHDLLFSKSKRIQSKQHAWKDVIIKNKPRLEAALVRLKIKHNVQNLEDLIEEDDTPVRWFRTNIMKTNTTSLLNEFKHLQKVDSIDEIKTPGVIFHDPYIPNLFGIHPREKLTTTDAYLKGRVIIQDRASCFPAVILNPQKGEKIIDACAAPGNKTTHLACILEGEKDSITAFEKDNKRINVIKMMVEKAGGLDCIKIQHGDFTDTRPEDFPEITGMLVDPSCSGSGIFGRQFDEQDERDSGEKKVERLANLSAFQFRIVKHALSFPNVKRVVYSTCSINEEENEQVTRRLLEDDDIRKMGWRMSNKRDVLPKWPRRGNPDAFEGMDFSQSAEQIANACVRTIPKVDGGIGFFAVSFQRE